MMRANRLHTIRDIDCGEPPISALGGRREPSLLKQPEFNFGGANLGLPQPEAVHKLPHHTTPSMRHSFYFAARPRPSQLVKSDRYIIPR